MQPIDRNHFAAVAGVALLTTFLSTSLWAVTPSLTEGNASGAAGSIVNVPITYDPGTAQIPALSFTLAMPTSLSLVSFSTGSVVTAANASILIGKVGGNINFLIEGLQNIPIAAGNLATLQLMIAPGTGAQTLNIPVSNAQYSDTGANDITAGTTTSGAVTVTGSAAAPAITLTKSVDKTSAGSGAILTYTIKYQNTGPADATNAIITDPIPTGTTLVANSISNGGTVSAGIITWNLGTVTAGGAQQQVSFQVQVQ